MGYTDDLLDDIRAQIQPDETVVKEAKQRREIVLAGAATHGLTQKTVRSGSLAHGTAICPIHRRDKGLDADGAVVLPQTAWPTLGPETATNQPPNGVVENFRVAIEKYVRAHGYPRATATTGGMKRAILVKFHEPLPGGEDPTVDLIIGLPRTAGGLWIPNLTNRRWDPSHPEMHTSLFLGPDSQRQLRVLRARAVRLAKAENKRTDPAALCSFNIEALAILYITQVMPLSRALLTLWLRGGQDLAGRLTPDPAHVSADIKVRDRQGASRRWLDSARQLDTALQLDALSATPATRGAIQDALRPLWPEYVPDRNGGTSQARLVAALQQGRPLHANAQGGLSTTGGTVLKRPQSFGDTGR